jgi:hypothetical protein
MFQPLDLYLYYDNSYFYIQTLFSTALPQVSIKV